jgi:hypothetical protein
MIFNAYEKLLTGIFGIVKPNANGGGANFIAFGNGHYPCVYPESMLHDRQSILPILPRLRR